VNPSPILEIKWLQPSEQQSDALMEGEIELLLTLLPEILQELDEIPSAECCAVR